MTNQSVRRQLEKGRLKKLFPIARDIGQELLDALGDEDWKVRRNSLRILDHAPVAGMEPKIIDLLRDDEPEVRKWAAHSLGCDRCKDGSLVAVDPVPYLVATAETDSSVEVRRSAIVCLAWNRPWEPRIDELMGRLAENSSDLKIRFHAKCAIERHREAST